MINHKGKFCIVDNKTFCQEGFCSECEIAHSIPIKWLKKKCIICHLPFEYVSNGIYEPETCANWHCVQSYLHPRKKESKLNA